MWRIEIRRSAWNDYIEAQTMQDHANQPAIRSVAVVGAGRMGGPMALNLLRAGFTVTAYDTSPAQLDALARQGLAAASSAQEAARRAEVVITMLPSDDALQQAIEGPGGLLEVLRPGQVLIDMSTSKLATSQRLAELLAGRGAAMLDAPVSGGERGAREGTLSIMVGGERAAFERCRPLLAVVGTTITYIGGSGMGLVAKYVNQMIMEAAFCTIAESFALAARAGADIEAVYQAVRGGLGGSPVLDQMLPQLLGADLGSGRELTLHHKDGAYALAAAEVLDAWAPITELTHALFDQALAAGQGVHSAAAVARVYERRLGVRLVQDEEEPRTENREP
ncbi:MAG: NAD(P)-dependent oxidoreductase [Roseiflexaceae bacterium]